MGFNNFGASIVAVCDSDNREITFNALFSYPSFIKQDAQYFVHVYDAEMHEITGNSLTALGISIDKYGVMKYGSVMETNPYLNYRIVVSAYAWTGSTITETGNNAVSVKFTMSQVVYRIDHRDPVENVAVVPGESSNETQQESETTQENEGGPE